MRIAVAGTGYVGLVTGVCLSEAGHHVTCYDISQDKINILNSGRSPIFEPGLDELLAKNIEASRLNFTTDAKTAYEGKECIFIAVGTPENPDGTANLDYVKSVLAKIAENITSDTILIIKSTVPVGTNEWAERFINESVDPSIKVELVSNPEFLREGSAIQDTFHGDRIVIGSTSKAAGDTVESIYSSFDIPVIRTDTKSAEMIKYASNVFLATKVSFINEIANLCEKTGADVEQVAAGMGMDHRIGPHFLRAGIGYGGSCFPKDTKALIKLAEQVDVPSHIMNAVLTVNQNQKKKLFEKASTYFKGNLIGKKAAVLGLSFKPNTDDIRESPALELINELLLEDVNVSVYDPIAQPKVEKVYGGKLSYNDTIEAALENADMAFIVTDWNEIKSFSSGGYLQYMKKAVLFDGRNCFDTKEMQKTGIQYFSIGRI
ncbi:UDP-glucose/GDP-mannose dehydrogenase family protein [Rossellomorea vietnamensis]|uniref:UDP-glucose 6-dehydrogenase n=1 Tax=Rossellomorea vietnamensis TaxID=218284 RepID=A0A5D4LZU0_9BACI|nr:UDP-glucose/GDP-mannose dehydrogenase family protein [Rossellomorea vietnamensis]TYR94881.1 UDP-glucose/GDP-mannose dehydrogenase family protein [Rossellomorea vietnamensis]